jgi:hypothetical protein
LKTARCALFVRWEILVAEHVAAGTIKMVPIVDDMWTPPGDYDIPEDARSEESEIYLDWLEKGRPIFHGFRVQGRLS